MIYLFGWLLGYVEFSFKNGFAEDFLTDYFNRKIGLHDVKKSGDFITAACASRVYGRLHRIALAHGGKIKIIKKRGLPFLLLPLKNRFGFFCRNGMLLRDYIFFKRLYMEC